MRRKDWGPGQTDIIKSMAGRLTILAALLVSSLLRADTGAERLRKIRAISFSPEQCYRVRDLLLEREDFKLYFTDGYLLFANPVEGQSLAALFLAATDTGEAEIVVMPPSPSERQSLARFAGTPVLEENIRTALMFFTDDTAQVLRRAMAENEFNHPDVEAGKRLAPDWQAVTRNMITNYDARMLMDAFTQPEASGVPRTGFFAAAISSVKLGRFDILLDPLRTEQAILGQVVWQAGQRYYDIWASFPERSLRSRGAERAQFLIDPGALEHYRIEAWLSADLSMNVDARATLITSGVRQRAVLFEISAQMKVTQVQLDGRPVEFLQGGALDSSSSRRRGDDWVLVISEEPLEPGSHHQIEFRYEGNVIADAGGGVYFVGDRGNWYPSRGLHFTDFDLWFHYPSRLQMVATGRELESQLEGDVRTSHWRPDAPIRVAGFNLGNFERASLKLGSYTLDVCANKTLERALQPMPVVAPPPLPPPRRRSPFRNPSIAPDLPPPEAPPSPTLRLEQVAQDSAEALQFFTQHFGPLPLRHLTISPIPGRFGQGFPGLIYLSTLSYYQAEDKPLEKLRAEDRLFYAEQLRAHEIAHQWWGNVVTTLDYHDEWLMESLADYSALMFLEQHKGPDVLEKVLGVYKSNLLSKTESGQTVESAGAIVLGNRLRSSRSPRARETITYEKGAWVLHMLRRRMGDRNFLGMLTELRRKYEYKSVNTEQFRELAAKFLPPNSPDPSLESFFSQWVYSTGVPVLQMEYKVTGKAPQFRVAGVIRQSGVPEDFSVAAPVEIQVPGGGRKIETRVQTANGETPFSITLRERPARVQLDPQDSILAIKQ